MRLDIELNTSCRPRPSAAQRLWLTSLSLLLLLNAGAPVRAFDAPENETGELHQKVISKAVLHPTTDLATFDATRSHLRTGVSAAWAAFTAQESQRGAWHAQIDRRSGLVELAEGAGVPWVPGHGNRLEISDLTAHLGGRKELDIDALESIARSFFSGVDPMLGGRADSLWLNRGSSGRYSDYLWLVDFDVHAGGLRIEGARVFFRVNNGNLIQFGTEKVPAADTPIPEVKLSRDDAIAVIHAYAGPDTERDRFIDKGSLFLLPVAAGGSQTGYDIGRGYDLIPVWELSFRRGAEHPTWRARINATNGEIVEFKDVNRYSQANGGYWPVSWRVDGIEQPQVITGWPFATISPTGGTSNASGLYTWDGNPQTARHDGPYVTINDSCTGLPGTAGTDSSGNIDFGTFNPPNSSTPGDCTNQLGIVGNTPAARQQYWHVNKIKEKARTYVPTNTWLQQQLGVNVNINLTCNAFWNGSTLNFYRTNGSCYNLGANAGVSMHEWGHGMDSNDGNGSSLENGTGETYGDFSAALQTLDQCIGNGIFISGVCGGYGNPCVAGGCDGVRDIDWGRHTANAPMTVASFTQPLCPSDLGGNYNGPCGDGAAKPDDKEGHCESYVSSGALWDLAAADLQSGCTGRNSSFPDYNCPGAGGPYNQAGAWGVVDRLWYLSRPQANQAFTCARTNPT